MVFYSVISLWQRKKKYSEILKIQPSSTQCEICWNNGAVGLFCVGSNVNERSPRRRANSTVRAKERAANVSDGRLPRGTRSFETTAPSTDRWRRMSGDLLLPLRDARPTTIGRQGWTYKSCAVNLTSCFDDFGMTSVHDDASVHDWYLGT